MGARHSAGILLFRSAQDGTLQVLLGHMGGPFWAGRDDAAWSIPKGELEPDEEPVAAARREFAQELGMPVPDGELLTLGSVRQRGGKLVSVWALRGDLDPDRIRPGTFTLQWPPRSGRMAEFPEIDVAAWLDVERARRCLVAGQRPFLDRLLEHLQRAVEPSGG